MRQFPGYWGTGPVPAAGHRADRACRSSEDATRIAALLSGEVDVVHDVPVQDIARLQQSQGIKVDDRPREPRDLPRLQRRRSAELKSSDMQAARTPSPTCDVRNAINIAVNREAITRVVMRGQGRADRLHRHALHQSGYSAELARSVAAASTLRPPTGRLTQAGYPRRSGRRQHPLLGVAPVHQQPLRLGREHLPGGGRPCSARSASVPISSRKSGSAALPGAAARMSWISSSWAGASRPMTRNIS